MACPILLGKDHLLAPSVGTVSGDGHLQSSAQKLRRRQHAQFLFITDSHISRPQDSSAAPIEHDLMRSTASSLSAGGSFRAKGVYTAFLDRAVPRLELPILPAGRVRLGAGAFPLLALGPPHLHDVNVDEIPACEVDPAVVDADFLQDPFSGTGWAQTVRLHRVLGPLSAQQLGSRGGEATGLDSSTEAYVNLHAPLQVTRQNHHHHSLNWIMEVASPRTVLVVGGFMAALLALRTACMLANPPNNTTSADSRNGEADHSDSSVSDCQESSEEQVVTIPMSETTGGPTPSTRSNDSSSSSSSSSSRHEEDLIRTVTTASAAALVPAATQMRERSTDGAGAFVPFCGQRFRLGADAPEPESMD